LQAIDHSREIFGERFDAILVMGRRRRLTVAAQIERDSASSRSSVRELRGPVRAAPGERVNEDNWHPTCTAVVDVQLSGRTFDVLSSSRHTALA